MPAVTLILRLLVALSAFVGGPPARAAEVVREWQFDAMADGIPIGTHAYVVREREDGRRDVESDMRFRVRLLIVDAYRFEHRATETWRGDCLAAIDTRTEEHGQSTAVSGRATDRGFEVSTAEGRAELPACVMTFAYWNPQVLRQSHLLNAQTGAWTPVTVETLGADTIDVRGRRSNAKRYRIGTAKNVIELWYANGGDEWVAMRTTTRDGHTLVYTLK